MILWVSSPSQNELPSREQNRSEHHGRQSRFRNGTVSGGIKIPGFASWLSDPSDGTATVVEGLDSVPEDERLEPDSSAQRPVM